MAFPTKTNTANRRQEQKLGTLQKELAELRQRHEEDKKLHRGELEHWQESGKELAVKEQEAQVCAELPLHFHYFLPPYFGEGSASLFGEGAFEFPPFRKCLRGKEIKCVYSFSH